MRSMRNRSKVLQETPNNGIQSCNGKKDFQYCKKKGTSSALVSNDGFSSVSSFTILAVFLLRTLVCVIISMLDH